MSTESVLIAKVVTEGFKKASEEMKNLTSESSKTEKAIGNIGKGFAVTAIVTAAIKFADSVINIAHAYDDLSDSAERLNMTVPEFEKMQFIFGSVGVSAEQATGIILKTEKAMVQLQTSGTGPLSKVLEQLSGTVKIAKDEFKGLSGEEGLALLKTRMDEANISGRDQSAILEQVAKGSSKLSGLLADNGKAYKELEGSISDVFRAFELSPEQEKNLSSLDSAANKSKLAWDKAATSIAASFAGILVDFLNLTTEMLVASSDPAIEILTKMNDLQGDIIQQTKDSEEAYNNWNKAIKANGVASQGLFNERVGTENKLRESQAKLSLLQTEYNKLLDSGNAKKEKGVELEDSTTDKKKKAGEAEKKSAMERLAILRLEQESVKTINSLYLERNSAKIDITGQGVNDMLRKSYTNISNLMTLSQDTLFKSDFYNKVVELRKVLAEKEIEIEKQKNIKIENDFLESKKNLNDKISELESKKGKSQEDNTSLQNLKDNLSSMESLEKDHYENKVAMAKTSDERIRINLQKDISSRLQLEQEFLKEWAILNNVTSIELNKEADMWASKRIDTYSQALARGIIDEKEFKGKIKEFEKNRNDFYFAKLNERASVEAQSKLHFLYLDQDSHQARLSELDIFKTAEIAKIYESNAEKVFAEQTLKEDLAALDEEYARRKAQIELDETQARLTNFASFADGMAGLVSGSLDAMKALEIGGRKDRRNAFYAMKAFSLASASLNFAGALAKAMDDPSAITLPQKLANYGLVASTFGSIMSTISSSKYSERAQGGMVNSSQPYIVGERGPELFVPHGNGSIVNNDKLRNGSNSESNITIINNTAGRIDKVEQRKADDGSTILIIKEVLKNEVLNPNSDFNRNMNKTRRQERVF